MPFIWCYKKPGMSKFCNAVIKLGQRFPKSAKLNVKPKLKSDTCVCDTIPKIARSRRTSLADGDQLKITVMGGGITCDRVKLEETGAKYYDIIVYYIQFEKP